MTPTNLLRCGRTPYGTARFIEAIVTSKLNTYEELWESALKESGADQNQSIFFKEHIPLDAVDFTDTAKAYHLDRIFYKAVTEMRGPYNCNMVYRQTQEMPDIVLYDNGSYIAFQPLGEPGRDLGDHASRVSHILVAAYGKDTPLTINEFLPSSPEEVADLGSRNAFLEDAYTALRNNIKVSECGPRVIQRAVEMGIPVTMRIRDFMVSQMSSFTKEFRESGRPGYILKDETGVDISCDKDMIAEMVERVFTDPLLKITKWVQGPEKCSQLLTHIHGFLLDPEAIPELIYFNYTCTEVIFNVKQEILTERGEIDCSDIHWTEEFKREVV